MVDPSPQIGLPNYEWIELKNTTSGSINLLGWKLSDANSSSGAMPNYLLKPDSLVIICSSSAVTALSIFGPAISVTNFPSLDNDADILSLKDAGGQIIYGVSYSSSWYQNDLKKNGGWTLEMIDTKSPCMGMTNWKGSINNAGGTPGKKNSVEAINSDHQSPRLQRVYCPDSITIVLLFDKPVDSLSGASISNYSIDGGLLVAGASVLNPLLDQVQLKLSSPVPTNHVYTITASNITDCNNNVIGAFDKARFGIAMEPGTGEIIVNEILFNPRPNAFDYIECFNNSNKIFDLSRLYVANRNSSNAISSIVPFSPKPLLFFPGDYIVVTEDLASLEREWFVKNPNAVMQLSSLPSFPDDKGYVILLDFQGNILDEVDYDHHWHFPLINNEEGVSLERVDPNGLSQDPRNWHSAGSTAGYGTPGYKNSQYKQIPTINASIETNPKLFSPDNDGIDDILTIQYNVDAPGYVANITVFDAIGRPVRNLVNNETLAISGHWNWDGLGDRGKKLPIGAYVIFSEIFNLQGKKSRFKNVVILARHVN